MKLAVCIPNYNRLQKLERLVTVLAEQITVGKLEGRVEICISDDCSDQKPDGIVEKIKSLYSDISVRLSVNPANMGMDRNFVNSVMMSESEYCWIVGNDDLPEKDALKEILNHLCRNKETDILVCPFDIYDEDDHIRGSVELLYGDTSKLVHFDTRREGEYSRLIESARDGNAIFCFLSNVVFKKEHWLRHKDMFEDKMDTIFIQMYMNLQTLCDGAVYTYTPVKFIRNYCDDEVNAAFKREYEVLMGLNGVIDYFFKGREHETLQKRIVAPRINGRMWDLPEDSPFRQEVLKIDAPRNQLYRNYFVRSENRESFFEGQDVLVYGAGDFGHKVIRELGDYHLGSMAVYDADANKWGKEIEGHVIEPAEKLFQHYHDRGGIVVVANNKSLEEIVEFLQGGKVARIAIIT